MSQLRGEDMHESPNFRLDDWFSPEEFLAARIRAFKDGLFSLAPVIKDAPTGVRELAATGARLVAVSNRFSDRDTPAGWTTQLEEWIHTSGFDFHDIKLGYDKLSIDFMALIDDSGEVIDKVRESGRLGIVFDQPWNRLMAPPRLQGWERASESISEILQGWRAQDLPVVTRPDR